MKIKTKIVLAFLSASLVILIPAGCVFYYFSLTALKVEIHNHLETAVQLKASHVNTLLNQYKEQTATLAAGIPFRNVVDESKDYDFRMSQINEGIKSIIEVHPEISRIRVLDKKGIVIASSHTDVGVDKSNHKIFLKGKEGINIGEVHISEFTGNTVITISAPILLNDVVFGVSILNFNINDLNKIMIEKAGLGETGEVYLISKDYYMITPSRFKEDTFLKQKVDTEGAKECFLHSTLPKEEIEKRHRELMVYPDYRGRRVLGGHVYIPEMQWALLAEIDEAEAFVPIEKLRGVLLISGMMIIFFGIIIAIFVAKNISDPIRSLHKGTEIIGSGNLDYKVGTDAKDEIGQLSMAFDRMTKDLKKTTISIDELNKEITERKKYEEVLRRANEEMKELDKMKSDFVSDVSHELRSPMTSIKGYTDIILMGIAGKINRQQREFLTTVKKNVDRLTRLINDLLDISRLEAKRIKLNLQTLNIPDLIQSVVKNYQVEARARKISLKTDLPKKFPLLRADSDRIKQVLTNLVNNALKFTAPHGKVILGFQEKKKEALFWVTDTGPGIARKDLSTIFEKFQQLGKEEKKATGLGLAIAKELVELHKGRIWIKSKRGKGSTFYFTLPKKSSKSE